MQYKERMTDKETMNLCIPRMDVNISKDAVYKIIKNLNIGCIQKVSEIPHRHDSSQKRILMRVSGNAQNDKFVNFKKQIELHGSIKLVYDMPWYWKIVLSHPQI